MNARRYVYLSSGRRQVFCNALDATVDQEEDEYSGDH